jgi:hypothetical protein
MEEEQYLTDELKTYYMSDFRNLLSFKGSEFWDIDEGLETLLEKINDLTNFQSLYSKMFKLDVENFATEGISYLDLAYRKEARDQLLQILNQVKDATSCNGSQVSIFECHSSDNANFRSESKLQIGCINNPDYFRIKHFKITIKSLNIECHDLFWKNIKLAFRIHD